MCFVMRSLTMCYSYNLCSMHFMCTMCSCAMCYFDMCECIEYMKCMGSLIEQLMNGKMNDLYVNHNTKRQYSAQILLQSSQNTLYFKHNSLFLTCGYVQSLYSELQRLKFLIRNHFHLHLLQGCRLFSMGRFLCRWSFFLRGLWG